MTGVSSSLVDDSTFEAVSSLVFVLVFKLEINEFLRSNLLRYPLHLVLFGVPGVSWYFQAEIFRKLVAKRGS